MRQPGRWPGRVGYALARRRLVQHLRATGVRDGRVLTAVEEVPRHLLLPEALWGQAYRDSPLPIGSNQTISQPFVVTRTGTATGESRRSSFAIVDSLCVSFYVSISVMV